MKNQNTENGNGETKARKVFYSEIALIGSVIGIVVGLMNYVINPQFALEIRTTKVEASIDGIKKDIANNQTEIREIRNSMQRQYDMSTDNNRLLKILLKNNKDISYRKAPAKEDESIITSNIDYEGVAE